MAMNIPLSKDEIICILQLGSLPCNWKSKGATISTCHGRYTFKNGYALSLFSECIKLFTEKTNGTHDSLFVSFFNTLSKQLPDLYTKEERGCTK